VILTGDSAGGNLCILVTMMAIMRGTRVPDGIFLMYPVLDLDRKEFYPSRLFSIDDPLLSTGLQK
jgi:acetyl esterase/lipase